MLSRRSVPRPGLAKARLHVIDGDLEEVTEHELTQAM